jgi:hypothetical protein
MADVNIDNLAGFSTIGSDLFDDSENFMVELSDDNVMGGGGISIMTIKSFCIGINMETCGVPKQDPCGGFGSCALATKLPESPF